MHDRPRLLATLKLNISLQVLKRWSCKSALFAALTLVVLNPNLKRTAMQAGHMLHPDFLVQTNFASLPAIDAQLDRFVAADHGRHSEPRLVARFVLNKIRYVSDYETWGNLDYWPTPEEVWERGQEDCDGRAVLAASVLRARGFHSTALAVSLDHMWITVDENEKDPTKPPHMIALLSPNPDFSLKLHSKSRFGDLLQLAKALFQPRAFRDSITRLFADIPALRRALLIVALLLLCYHPAKDSTGRLVVVALGLASAYLFDHWQPGQGQTLLGLSAGSLLLIALGGAILRKSFESASGVEGEAEFASVPSAIFPRPDTAP